MFITRECDYAVRVFRCLAGAEKLSVTDICEMESITAPFAYKILKKLEQAGYVKGYRGVHGGYSLAADPNEITLLDVYTAIEPDLFIIECLNPRHPCKRDGEGGKPCMVHRELGHIQDEFKALLHRKTLQQILEGR